MKKMIGILAGIALLCLGTTALATPVDPDPNPSTIHVNDGTTYLYFGNADPEIHALTDPASITLLSPDVTIDNLFVLVATPGDTEQTLGAATVVGSDGQVTDPAIDPVYAGTVDGTKGSNFVYKDILGLDGGNSSQNFNNYHDIDLALLGMDEDHFDIYQYDTGMTLFKGTAATASFESIPDGTFVFAYGFGDDGKLYCTPITETGLNVPEPSAMLLFGTGLIGLAGISRKRKKV